MLGFWICGFAFQMGGSGGASALGGGAFLNQEVTLSLFGKDFGLFGTKGFFLGNDVYDVTAITMPYKDLQDFIKHLDSQGELKRIEADLDPNLEIAEVTDRVSKKFGPALLFQKPRGGKFPVLTNMLALAPGKPLDVE